MITGIPLLDMMRMFTSKEAPAQTNAPEESSGNNDNPLLSFLRGSQKTGAKVEKVREGSKIERESIFGEAWESMLARYFPNVSKLMDVASAVGITSKDREATPWQNEFEGLTAFSLFVPDFLLRYLTDPLANSETFLNVLERWPLNGKAMADEIRAKKNPDDVINALRTMHQDMTTGKVSVDKIF